MLKVIFTFLPCRISFLRTRSITERPEKDTQLLKLVETTKPIACSIFCLILQFILIKTHIFYLPMYYSILI